MLACFRRGLGARVTRFLRIRCSRPKAKGGTTWIEKSLGSSICGSLSLLGLVKFCRCRTMALPVLTLGWHMGAEARADPSRSLPPACDSPQGPALDSGQWKVQLNMQLKGVHGCEDLVVQSWIEVVEAGID